MDESRIRMRLDLAYDGTGFAGWAKQPGLRTVQGVLEEALATVLRDDNPPVLTVAGRTDAGVHATGQVAHLDLTPEQLRSLAKPHGGRPAPDPGSALVRRINGIAGLRSDVVLTRAALAPDGFDARFSPVWRRYEYRIADSLAARNPLHRLFTTWYPSALDVDAMNVASDELVGLHDWAAYCKPRAGSTTIRELQEFRWVRGADGVITAHLKADAFCHSMVRALVGAGVALGEGKLASDRMVGIRREQQRTSEFKVMPAQGLTLVEVGYPEDADLAARAERTRARRDDEAFDQGTPIT
ncbi:tRNA pseudouridine(38-40) synthase TruA [Antiquaquibacter oligotrophicus]|nr:tRNA pseudouridine(38-40) synthase TruA [Antiquaquibacter oligotrophicus]UDF14680.1 tRNA pseudouridine(38-40) synthase TruA [Antiquaquibacter oligotrophicus]